jgi:colanic acid biosynthesis glycosyl transferase WcaI
MKIHQITQLFHPDSLGGAALYTDLARFLRDRGHEVRVTTTFSYFPRLRYLPEDRGVAMREESFETVPLRRVAMTLPAKHRGWRRLIPELTYWRALKRRGRFQGWRPDVIFTTSPMLAQPLAAASLYAPRVPAVVVVQDLMSDAAQRLRMVGLPGLGSILARAEQHALRGSTQLVTIDDAMKARLVEFARPARDVPVIRNWIHGSLEAAAQATQARGLRRRARTLFYSGNLGMKQGLPDFLRDFATARGEWMLRVHGDGAEAAALRGALADVTGVEFAALSPETEYVERLTTTAACLITQRPGTGGAFFPSKLLPALATGTPVLAVCEADSPLGVEVRTHGYGAVIPPGDRAALRETLTGWASAPERLDAFSKAARLRAGMFSRENALARYEALLAATAESAR